MQFDHTYKLGTVLLDAPLQTFGCSADSGPQKLQVR